MEKQRISIEEQQNILRKTKKIKMYILCKGFLLKLLYELGKQTTTVELLCSVTDARDPTRYGYNFENLCI